MSQRYFIKADNTLSCITETVASRSTVVITPLCSADMKQYLHHCVHFLAPRTGKAVYIGKGIAEVHQHDQGLDQPRMYEKTLSWIC